MDQLFEGSGLGSLRPAYEALDWSTTPLGPIGSWSPTLRSTVMLALNSRFPITLLWGPQFVLVYNEAYAATIGDKHPTALGAPCEQIFPEIWDTIGPMMTGVREQRTATWTEDERLLLRRNGMDEETYFTFCYSPVLDADGVVEGLIDISAETTREVVDRRRLTVLARLTATLADAEDTEGVVGGALKILRDSTDEVSFAEVRGPYLETGDTFGARSAAEAAHPSLVRTLSLDGLSLASRDASLVLGLSPNLPFDDGYADFVRLLGAAVTQALDRVGAHQQERRSAELERQMSMSLQRSLLSRPPQPAGLQVAVRYHAAAEQARVGGDWYDAFELASGALTLVVGDVTGHDRQAAASMAQVRNLARGVAYLAERSPAEVLTGLDRAMRGLAVGTLATAVLACVETADAPVLRWSNAGHPPPVLIGPDGRRELLEATPDLMLGVLPDHPRHEHTVALAPGSTVVFYTDGLVERRGVDLTDSLQVLLDGLAGAERLDAEQVCDRLLAEFGASTDDDIALLVLRVE